MSISSISTRLLVNQHIAITGGVGGLAKPIIKSFISHGAKVSVADILPQDKPSELFDIDVAMCENIIYKQCDVTKEDDVKSFIDIADKNFGPINTACIHSGIVSVTPILEESVDNFQRIMNTNVTGSFIFSQKCAQHMIDAKQSGHLLFTSSWVAENNWPGLISYGASKAAVNSLMKSYALELSQFGIRSNAVSPGMVDVGMARKYYEMDQAYHDCVDTSIPLGKMQPIQSVVDIFVFLCSPASEYMNGSVITVDGGAHLVNKHTVPIYYKQLNESDGQLTK